MSHEPALGSTAIHDAVDTSVILKRTERYRTISSEQRYGDDFEETTLRYDPQTRIITLRETKAHEDETLIARAILDYLHIAAEPATQAQIDAKVEGRTRMKRNALRNLLKAETIQRSGKESKGDRFRYFINEPRPNSAENMNPADETSENPGRASSGSHHVPLFQLYMGNMKTRIKSRM